MVSHRSPKALSWVRFPPPLPGNCLGTMLNVFRGNCLACHTIVKVLKWTRMFTSPFYVYVCLSLKDRKLYVGSTNNLERRQKEHSDGLVTSTKHRQPFELIYYGVYLFEKDARLREKYLKSGGRARANLKLQLEETLKEKGYNY